MAAHILNLHIMISVIIPYNKDRGFLKDCVRSIEAQTYKDFEIIYAYSENPVVINFNHGLMLADGEFIKWVTDDDWLPPNSLQDLIDGIGDAPWAYANAIQYQHPVGDTWIYKPAFHSLAANIAQNQIHGGTTIYRTSVLKEIGGMNESLWTGEEYDMHLKLWTSGYHPVYIDKEVYYHRLWNGQKSKKLRRADGDKRAAEIKRIQDCYKDWADGLWDRVKKKL